MPNLNLPTVTWRPGGARYVAYGVAIILIVMTAVIGVELPDDILFTVAELVTLALILIAALAMLHGVGRSKVVVDESGLLVRNGYRDRAFEWSEIIGFGMNVGAPWPTMVTKADDHVMLFAIQGTDGPMARAALEELRRRLESHR